MKSILGQLLNGRYFVVRQLQQTPSHITYLADDRHKLESSQCLVKQYKISIPKEINGVRENAKFRSFIFKEIDKIRQFNHHPQIPYILDYFFWAEELYIIREFIKGETVEEEIAYRTLEESEVLHLLKETLPILDAIHQSKQMHLNLKPSNIIFAADTQQIFLADSAHLQHSLKNRIVKSQIIEATSTENNYYLAPEQNSVKTQISSDFYALGNIAIQALTGKHPHQIRLCNLDNYARASLVDIETSQSVNISSQLAKILYDLTNINSASRDLSARDILKSLTPSENIVFFPSPEEVILPEFEPSQKQFKAKSKGKKNNLLFFLFSGLLIAPLLATAFQFLNSDRQQQYAKYLEYQNPDYSIELKYPQDWKIKELEDPITGGILVMRSPLDNELDSFQEKIYLSVDRLKTTPEKYTANIIENIKNTSGTTNIVYQKETKRLANKPTQSITYQRKQGELYLQQKETFAVKDGNIYLVTYIAEQDRYQDLLTTVERVIESFKFVE